MKIRPSLRLYFFISVVLLGSTMTIGFSLLSVNYFIDGLDRAVNGVMQDLAYTAEVENGQPKHIAGFTVASRWQDTPAIIQQRFITPPIEIGQLHKIKDQTTFFLMPENVFFVVLYNNPQGEKRYISRVMRQKDGSFHVEKDQPIAQFYWMLIIALIVIALFAFFLVMIMRKIAKPIESLKSWAKSLNQDTLKNPPPDFSFSELNILAALVQSSLISTHQSLDREQRFLSYASHELRTPIAVIRSNVELLQRLSEKAPLSDKQQLTLQRIQRAGLTMSNLTDTLLWLSRNEQLELSPEPIDIHEKIQQLCTELEYLLNAKNVEVCINSEAGNSVNVEAIACHIVLSNLIRNAYQHTQYGQIHIKHQGSRVTIINSNNRNGSNNSNNSDNNTTPKTDSNTNPVVFGHGYGLGLQLSEKIIKRHGWFYEVKEVQGSYQVTVDFG